MFSRFHRYVNNKDMLGLLTNKSSTSRSSDVKKNSKNEKYWILVPALQNLWMDSVQNEIFW